MKNFKKGNSSSNDRSNNGGGQDSSVASYSKPSKDDGGFKAITMHLTVVMFNDGTNGPFPRELLAIHPWDCTDEQMKLYEDWMVGVVFAGGWYAKALIEQGGQDSQLLFMDRVRRLLQTLDARYQNVSNWCTPGQGKCVTLWSILNQSLAHEFGMHHELVRVFAALNGMIVEPVEGLGGGQYRENHRIRITVVPRFLFLTADEFVGFQEISEHYLITRRVNAEETAVAAHDQDELMNFQRPGFQFPVTSVSAISSHVQDSSSAVSANHWRGDASRFSEYETFEEAHQVNCSSNTSSSTSAVDDGHWHGSTAPPCMPFEAEELSKLSHSIVERSSSPESTDAMDVETQVLDQVDNPSVEIPRERTSSLRPFVNKRKRFIQPPSPHHRVRIEIQDDEDINEEVIDEAVASLDN
eukprot:gene34387-42412_t